MDIKNLEDVVIYTSALLTIKDALVEAVLKRANLCGANLYGANLCDANLCDANLCGANLYGANLYGANLCGANLYGANLYGANLCGADLRGANLRGANLYGADLYGAYLSGTKNSDIALSRIQFIPETGSFEAWKKCADGVIVKLLIPEDAERSHGAERKCRASKIVVLDVFGADYGVSGGEYGKIEYRKGQTVEPKNGWNEDRWTVCGAGIHFFLTRAEAENYEF
jgi:hypothetical protein